MVNYYLDIETTGLDPVDSKIITIQYAELERGTGKQIGDVKILKEWESGEKEMIAKFIEDTPIISSNDFDFVPIGYNLGFEHKFLFEKTKQHQLNPISVLDRPLIDLHSIGIMMNKGEFLGSGLDKLTGKPHSGSIVPDWYVEQDYTSIENYIIKETEEFVKLLVWAHDTFPSLRSSLDNVMHF